MGFVIIKPKALYQSLKKNHRDISDKQKEEVLAGLTLRPVYKKIFNTDFWIGWPCPDTLENRAVKILQERDERSIVELIKLSEQYNPIDICLVRFSEGKVQNESFMFQIKIFGKGKESKGNTATLMKFLEKYKFKYQKGPIRLAIALHESVTNIDYQSLVDLVNASSEYPFLEIVILVMFKNGFFEAIQILPNNGHPNSEVFSKAEVISELE